MPESPVNVTVAIIISNMGQAEQIVPVARSTFRKHAKRRRERAGDKVVVSAGDRARKDENAYARPASAESEGREKEKVSVYLGLFPSTKDSRV